MLSARTTSNHRRSGEKRTSLAPWLAKADGISTLCTLKTLPLLERSPKMRTLVIVAAARRLPSSDKSTELSESSPCTASQLTRTQKQRDLLTCSSIFDTSLRRRLSADRSTLSKPLCGSCALDSLHMFISRSHQPTTRRFRGELQRQGCCGRFDSERWCSLPNSLKGVTIGIVSRPGARF